MLDMHVVRHGPGNRVSDHHNEFHIRELVPYPFGNVAPINVTWCVLHGDLVPRRHWHEVAVPFDALVAFLAPVVEFLWSGVHDARVCSQEKRQRTRTALLDPYTNDGGKSLSAVKTSVFGATTSVSTLAWRKVVKRSASLCMHVLDLGLLYLGLPVTAGMTVQLESFEVGLRFPCCVRFSNITSVRLVALVKVT